MKKEPLAQWPLASVKNTPTVPGNTEYITDKLQPGPSGEDQFNGFTTELCSQVTLAARRLPNSGISLELGCTFFWLLLFLLTAG